MEPQSALEYTAPPPVTKSRGMPRFAELGLVVVIVALSIVLSAYGWHDARPGRPNTFFNFENLVEGIANPMSYFAIMAVGMTFVIITGGIDISVGSMMALCALGSAAVLQNFPSDAPAWKVLPVAIAVPLVIGLLCGLLNGALIVGLNLHPFIVTLGTMSIYRGLANVLPWFWEKTLPTGGRSLPDAFTADFMRFKVHVGKVQIRDNLVDAYIEPMPLIIMLVCVVLGWLYLRLSIAGRETYAIGGNEEAARFSGINVKRVKLRVYALVGVSCGIAGMVSLGRFGTASTSSGNGYELTVIAAAVVGGASLSGGRGTAIGALLGTLVIALIENGIYILHLQQEYRLIIIGTAIILAVAMDRVSDYFRQRSLVRSAATSMQAAKPRA
jgi:ribose/xylose/arabinose/galactoside ABC-type transport system permease subunit